MEPLNVVLYQDDAETAERLTASLSRYFPSIYRTRSREEIRPAIARSRAEVLVLDVEKSDGRELKRLHQEFPGLYIVCTHRLADDELWLRRSEGADDLCHPRIPTKSNLHSLPANAPAAPLPDSALRFIQGRLSASPFHFGQACLLYCDAMLKQVLEEGRERADRALERLLPPATHHPTSIHQAMRHSVFAGGKRLRPILCMEAGRMVAQTLPDGIEDVGAALEMLHTYSLIHDDLPALDNDDLRRGRPYCHKAFGEAIAILAGDALETQAHEVLAQLNCSAEARVAIIREIAHQTGTVDGMIGGQVVDLEAEHTQPGLETLEYIHRAKTAALITASVVSGGIQAGKRMLPRSPVSALSANRLDWPFKSSTTSSTSPRPPNNWARPPAKIPPPRKLPIPPCSESTNRCGKPTHRQTRPVPSQTNSVPVRRL